MPSRASTAQGASGRDLSVTQLSSTRPASRESVTSNIGQRCAHDGCGRMTLTGGPRCYTHTLKHQLSPPIRGSAQIRGTDCLSPANSQMKKESTSPGRPGIMSPAAAGNGPSRRSDAQNLPHPAKGLNHKFLPAKATARKSVAKPSQRREDSNSAAADEAEIVVASNSTTSTNKPKASKRTLDNAHDSPRKKQRLGPELSTMRPAPQPATTSTAAAISSTSLAAAQNDEAGEQLRSESRAREASPPHQAIRGGPDLRDGRRARREKAAAAILRSTSAAKLASEKLNAIPASASNFQLKERPFEREKSSGQAPTQELSLKKPGQSMPSPSIVELNKGETNKGHPVLLSIPKPPLGYGVVGSSRSRESSWQSTVLAPEPVVKKPRWTEFLGRQIGHKPAAQSQTAYSWHPPLAMPPGLKGLVSEPAVEATRQAPSTIVPDGGNRNSQPAVIPTPTAKLQISGDQHMTSSAVNTKPRTEKATCKTSCTETAAGQVPTPVPQSSGMSSRPGVSTIDASSSTDRMKFWDIVQGTTQPVSRASSFKDKEPPPVLRDVASFARNLSANSQPIQTPERRLNAKNEHGQHAPAAPRQPISSEQSMRTTEVSCPHVSACCKPGVPKKRLRKSVLPENLPVP